MTKHVTVSNAVQVSLNWLTVVALVDDSDCSALGNSWPSYQHTHKHTSLLTNILYNLTETRHLWVHSCLSTPVRTTVNQWALNSFKHIQYTDWSTKCVSYDTSVNHNNQATGYAIQHNSVPIQSHGQIARYAAGRAPGVKIVGMIEALVNQMSWHPVGVDASISLTRCKQNLAGIQPLLGRPGVVLGPSLPLGEVAQLSCSFHAASSQLGLVSMASAHLQHVSPTCFFVLVDYSHCPG